MFQRSGRGRSSRGSRRGRASDRTSLVRGLLLDDGSWKCDCDPRLPAVYHEVKKNGPNKGRWFYTCQKPIGEQCDFFIFKEDADARAKGVLFSNPNSGGPSRRSPINSPTKVFLSPPPAYATQDRQGQQIPASSSETVQNLPLSRTASESMFVMDSDDEKMFEHIEIPKTPLKHTLPQSYTTPSKSISQPAFVTPSKASMSESYNTPTKRKLSTMISGGLPTPVTAARSGGPKGGYGGQTSLLDELSPESSPTPLANRDMPKPDEPHILLPRLLQILQQQRIHLPESGKQALEEVCQEYSQKVKGIQKARDLTRSALKAKDSKTHELQLRVNTLEAELELQKGIVQWYRERYPDDQLDD